jgi:ARG and Rhodanese-Phosphatase-superfamily-associated Protein domain
MPSREAKLAMRAPIATASMGPDQADGSTPAYQVASGPQSRQQKVWAEVAKTQRDLSDQLTASVASAQSETSLQLSLEHEKLRQARADYVAALEPRGGDKGDIVGYVIAINGKVSSADVYPSNALFKKMWPKQLAAGTTEAIGAKSDKPAAAPGKADVAQFMADAEQGKASQEAIAGVSKQEVRNADAGLFIEARTNDGTWVHRNYLAK